jgi:hypothetical protein
LAKISRFLALWNISTRLLHEKGPLRNPEIRAMAGQSIFDNGKVKLNHFQQQDE